MRTLKTLVILGSLVLATAAHADDRDSFQPAVYFTIKFGGKRASLQAPRLDARLQVAGTRDFLSSAEASPPSLVRWQVDSRGSVLSLGGTPIDVRLWSDPSMLSESTEVKSGVTTGVVATAAAVGVGYALLVNFTDAFGRGAAEAAFAPDSGTSGSSDSGNTGDVCVGDVCTPGGG